MLDSEIIIGYRKKYILKYRYILISVIAIIIILLMIIMAVIFNQSNKENASQSQEINRNNDSQEKAMLVELNNKEKDEEEKQEEENATGVIYLTFDDGPSADITPHILDILSEKNIKATFFVIHYSENNAELVKREMQNGHTVALHGYTHTYSEVYASSDACLENFRKIQEQVYQTTGKKSNIIRFPGGSSNTISRKYSERSYDRSNAKSIR